MLARAVFPVGERGRRVAVRIIAVCALEVGGGRLCRLGRRFLRVSAVGFG
jgi:hypothetical protein